MRRRRPVLAATLTLLLIAATAACGSRRSEAEFAAARSESGSSAADPGTQPGAGDEAAAAGAAGQPTPDDPSLSTGDAPGDVSPPTGNGEPVRIGLVGTLSGPVGATLAPVRDGVQTWVAAANDRGGVNGHPIELVVADDRADASRHRALVQQLVEERDVVALVGGPDGLTGASTVDYINDHHIPVIGGDLGASWAYDSPYYFPQASSGLALVQAAVASISAHAISQGQTKVAFVACTEVQVCRDSAAVASKLAKSYGVDLVYAAQVSLFQPDFTAECINAKNAGAQVMGVVLDGNGIGRVAQSCARQGYHPTFAFTSTVILPGHHKNPDLQGAYIPVNLAPWFADTPAVAEYRNALATYAPDLEASAGTMIGWVSGKLFERATRDLVSPTGEEILAGLYGIRGDDLGGLTHPLTFTAGTAPSPVVCWFNVQITDERFVSPDGGTRHCDDYRL